ncbi:MAG: hypothetical protein DPW16_01780 [Chloroflexi bacterium]|nr:hypothetical protein [Chloroflexota bacterium]
MGRRTHKEATPPAKKKTTSSKGHKKPAPKKKAPSRFQQWLNRLPALFVVALAIYFLVIQVVGGLADWVGISDSGQGDTFGRYDGLYETDRELAELFSPSVDYWEPAIYQWSQDFGLNPNLVATVIQIESCGDPYAVSNAGAQGLFQVMPANFQEPGLNQLDPMDNARIGLNILAECLRFSRDPNFDGEIDGPPDVGLALVCYNGGPSVLSTPREQWVQESQNYYKWGTGIWADASQGRSTSSTLNEWVAAGGWLCDRARTRQQLLRPLPSLTLN